MSLSCLLHELDIIAVHKYVCTYRTNHNIHCWCPSAGAARLAKPGRRQTTAPTVPAPGRAGDASTTGGDLGPGYLPGAPDEPSSPPAPTRQTRRAAARTGSLSAAMVDDVSSRPPWWTMLNAVCSNAASTFNIACTVLQAASKSCLMISVSFGCAGF